MVLMVLIGLYTIVDMMFVARFVNMGALSAMNIVCPVINLIVALGTMPCSGRKGNWRQVSGILQVNAGNSAADGSSYIAIDRNEGQRIDRNRVSLLFSKESGIGQVMLIG